MWVCPKCGQKFIHENSNHSCGERTVQDFLAGKSPHTIELFNFFIGEYMGMADFTLHPAKARIGFAAKIRFGYVVQLGKNFIDVVLQFREPYRDTLCFHKVAQVPGSNIYNHYFRLYEKEDLTDELREYLIKAYEIGQRKHIK